MAKWCIDRLTKVYSTRIEEVMRSGGELVKDYPPGIINIPTHFLGRYREFEVAMNSLLFPPGSVIAWGLGASTGKNMNDAIRQMLKNDIFKWVWVIGDDHVFSPDIILQLLRREKEVVVPFCCRRTFPYIPIIHESGGENNDYATVEYEWFKDKTGLVNLNDTGKLTGNAGMLVKREVFEAIPEPWYEVGQIHSEYNSPDLWFAKKMVDAGFPLFVDMDNPIGHITHMSVWPFQDPDTGEWKAEMRYPNDVWGERGLIVD